MAGWWLGANMKPTPTCSIQRATCSAPRSRWMPATAKRSALPDDDDTPRLPCLATWPPAAATTKLAAVETLKRLALSPPVPTMSTTFSASRCTGFISSRITWAAALISSAVSPFMAMPIRKAATWASLASPVMIWRITSWVSAKLRFSWRIRAPRASRICIMALHDSGTAQRRLRTTLWKVGQQLMALAGKDRLGVELHPLHVELPVAKAHDQPRGDVIVVDPGGDLQAVGQRGALHHQGMVAGHLQRVLEAREEPEPRVANGRGLAVHHLGGAHHLAAVDLADGLVTQADAQYRQPAGEVANGLQGDARLVGGAGPRRDHQVTGGHRLDPLKGDGVVAVGLNLGPQLPQVLHHIEGEAVVVVDHADFHGSLRRLIRGCPGRVRPWPRRGTAPAPC